MADAVAKFPGLTWWCPQLPASPLATAALLAHGTKQWPAATSVVMGSSLGGYYATWLMTLLNCRAILINPAIRPARDLSRHIGKQSFWHDPVQQFDFTAKHVEELDALKSDTTCFGNRVMTMIAKGDEVLDWQEMRARYLGSKGILLEAGDHALTDFEQYLPDVLEFLGFSRPCDRYQSI